MSMIEKTLLHKADRYGKNKQRQNIRYKRTKCDVFCLCLCLSICKN